MSKVINIANFKGGVGKTTTTVLFSYLLAEQKEEKVLLIDFDPQGNATDLIFKTYGVEIENIEQPSIYQAMRNNDLSTAIVPCADNLHIAYAEGDLRNFPRLLLEKFKSRFELYPHLLDALLAPIRDQYDYIFIDVPPTISDYTDSAIIASDYLALVMQTQEFSLGATEQFLPYVERLLTQHDTSIKFVGTIPVLMQKRGRTDQYILSEAEKIFRERLMTNHIQIRERIKAWGLLGIKDEDMHDRAVLEMYDDLLNEFLIKMEE